MLQPSFPVPNCTSCGTNNYSVTAIEPNDYDQAVVRSDQTLSSKHSLFERYVYYTASEIVPSVQSGVIYPQLGHNVSIGDTYLISSSIVNEVRLGYNRAYGFTDEVNPVPGKNWVAEAGLQNISGGVNPSEYGRPSITITGYTGLGEGGNSQGDTENIYSAGDTVSDVIGKHTFRVGAQFQWRQVRQLTDTPARGSFTFASLATYQDRGLLHLPGRFRKLAGPLHRQYLWRLHERYLADRAWLYFELRPSLGVRLALCGEEWAGRNVRSHDRPDCVSQGPRQYSRSPSSPSKHHAELLSRRHGATRQEGFWSASRGGLPGERREPWLVSAMASISTTPTSTSCNSSATFLRSTSTPRINNASFVTQTLMPSLNQLPAIPAPFSLYPGNRVPYTQEWTVSVQQDLGHGTVFELGYTGSVTHKLWKRFDQNEDAFAVVGGLPGPRPFQNFLHGMLTSKNEGGSRLQRALGQTRAAQPQRSVLSGQLPVVEESG